MRYWRLVIVVVAMIVLQLGLVPAVRPLGVVPNLLLGLVALVGLLGTASVALAVALAGGLVLDLASGADFGLRMGLFVLVALVAGLVHRAGLTLGGPVVALVLVAVATVVADAAVLAGLVGIATQWPLGLILARLGLEVVLNLGLTLGLSPLVRWALPSEAPLPVIG